MVVKQHAQAPLIMEMQITMAALVKVGITVQRIRHDFRIG